MGLKKLGRWDTSWMRDPVRMSLVSSINLLYVILSLRFSVLLRDKPLCSSWEKKMEAKREKELVKRFTLQLKEEKARQKEVSYRVWWLNPCNVTEFAAFFMFFVFPGFIGKEEKERRQLETSCRERTESRDCPSGTSAVVDTHTKF